MNKFSQLWRDIKVKKKRKKKKKKERKITDQSALERGRKKEAKRINARLKWIAPKHKNNARTVSNVLLDSANSSFPRNTFSTFFSLVIGVVLWKKERTTSSSFTLLNLIYTRKLIFRNPKSNLHLHFREIEKKKEKWVIDVIVWSCDKKRDGKI